MDFKANWRHWDASLCNLKLLLNTVRYQVESIILQEKKKPLIVKCNLFLLLLMCHFLKAEFSFWGNRYQSDSASGKKKTHFFSLYLLSQGVFLMCFNDKNYIFHTGVKSLWIFASASAALCSDQGKLLSREGFQLWEAHKWKSTYGFGCTYMIPIIPLKWVIEIFPND